MCSCQDGWNDLATLNAKLYSIRRDSAFTHHERAKTQRLNMRFLQDHVCAAPGAYASLSPGSCGIYKRTVFLIGKNGISLAATLGSAQLRRIMTH